MDVDTLGRTTELTDPTLRVTYTVYMDPVHEVRTYPGWYVDSSSEPHTTGPIQVTVEDRANGIINALTMSAAPNTTGGVPNGTEPITNLDSLSRSHTNTGGQVTATDEYFALAGLTYPSSLGSEDTNFATTDYGYDARGRQDRAQAPDSASGTPGTITRTVFDGLGRTVSTWEGTNDTGALDANPSNSHTAPNDMREVSENHYDGTSIVLDGVGDSNVTQQISFVNASTSSECITDNWFDWRNRLIVTKDSVPPPSGLDTTNEPLRVEVLDNLGEEVASYEYTGDGITPTYTNGVPGLPAGDGVDLRKFSTAALDNQGQTFESQMFTVDQTTGAIGAALTSKNFETAAARRSWPSTPTAP